MEAIKSGVAKKVLISALSPHGDHISQASGPSYATVGRDTGPPGKRARIGMRVSRTASTNTPPRSRALSTSRPEAVLEGVPSKPIHVMRSFSGRHTFKRSLTARPLTAPLLRHAR
jgi:hypothetical protein